MKKQVLFRAALVGAVILLAACLLTCDAGPTQGLNPASGPIAEYSDWEYVPQADGTALLTLMLDGSTPFVSANNNRALNEGIAKRSHDYFEAIFVAGAAGSETVARASWEIGQPAGIRGVLRGVDYAAYSPTVSTTAAIGNALICVGRRVNNGVGTLLAVGWVHHVTDANVIYPTGAATPTSTSTIYQTDSAYAKILSSTKSVTFLVSAIETKVGFDFSEDTVDMNPGTAFANAVAGDGYRDTFWTGTLDTTSTPNYIAVTAANTQAGVAKFKNDATYTMFGLPAWDPADTANITPAVTGVPAHHKIKARYKIALTAESTDHTTPIPTPTTTDPLESLWFSESAADPKNFQVIERLAIYQTNGQLYDVVEADLDTVTTVVPDGYADTKDTKFIPTIPLEFRVSKGSGGAFAFTFQVPVYALAKDGTLGGPAKSTNGGPDATTWYIRPAHGQPLYLLDNGQTAGGAVLMGVGISSFDWLEINVIVLGFTN